MIGSRHFRSCDGTTAVAGSHGHLRCPHCNFWMPTRESWTMPLMYFAILGFAIYWVFNLIFN